MPGPVGSKLKFWADMTHEAEFLTQLEHESQTPTSVRGVLGGTISGNT